MVLWDIIYRLAPGQGRRRMHCTEISHMGLLQNTCKLTENQRKAVALLVAILTFTSTHVQAAENPSDFPEASGWETGQTAENDIPERGLRLMTSYNGKFKDAGDVPAVRMFRATITAYSSFPSECDDSPFVTADGSRVRDGIVAANFLKFGTRIRIPELFGDKIFEVHDRMNPRYANRIDIWMERKSDGRKFGIKRNILIEVL